MKSQTLPIKSIRNAEKATSFKYVECRNVYSTNRIDVASSKVAWFVHSTQRSFVAWCTDICSEKWNWLYILTKRYEAKAECWTHRQKMVIETAEMAFLMIITSKIHEFITYFLKLLLSTLSDLLMIPTSQRFVESWKLRKNRWFLLRKTSVE